MKKIFIAVNSSWNIVNFRKGLINKLISNNYEVSVISPSDEYLNDLIKLGCSHINIVMDKKGTNPIRDFKYFFNIFFLLYSKKPDVLFCYTIKPNIYASIASKLLGIPVINNITGLGRSFIKKNFLTMIVKFLYKISLLRSKKIFFQNIDDLNLFKNLKLINNDKTVELLPGSGINLNTFFYDKNFSYRDSTQVNFIMISRLLWDKGVEEFVEASKLIKKNLSNINFFLLGSNDDENPSSIPNLVIKKWIEEGVFTYLGYSKDVRKFIKDSDCVVLPSYREGAPKSLLEACAIGRPIIATDVPGCRDIVENELNGYLCKNKDPKDLAEKMHRIIKLNHKERVIMGLNGRKKVEKEFDETIVINKYVQALNLIFK